MDLSKRPAVLFVCTANICRSPMAAALFRARLKNVRADWQNWLVDSAGTWALDGEPAAKNSRQVMAQRGLDISNHRARTVTAKMLQDHDLILTMEPGQKEALCVEFPALADRIFLLSEMEGRTAAIDDPIGQALPAYEKAAENIDRILVSGMPRILSLVIGKQTQRQAS